MNKGLEEQYLQRHEHVCMKYIGFPFVYPWLHKIIVEMMANNIFSIKTR